MVAKVFLPFQYNQQDTTIMPMLTDVEGKEFLNRNKNIGIDIFGYHDLDISKLCK